MAFVPRKGSQNDAFAAGAVPTEPTAQSSGDAGFGGGWGGGGISSGDAGFGSTSQIASPSGVMHYAGGGAIDEATGDVNAGAMGGSFAAQLQAAVQQCRDVLDRKSVV